MPRFFVGESPQGKTVIEGEDGKHISRSLRMQPGEELILCDGKGTDFICEIRQVQGDEVTVQVIDSRKSAGEPSVLITVYQGLPKSDKMDLVAQKIVEVGASHLVPMMTSRCVSRPDAKSAEKKRERWQKIADEAAKQCGRGKLPQVEPLTDFTSAVLRAEQEGEMIFFYEGGGDPLRHIVKKDARSLSIFIGPEGGFSESEVLFAKEHGAAVGSLGPRILRTETAATVAVTAILLLTDNI